MSDESAWLSRFLSALIHITKAAVPTGDGGVQEGAAPNVPQAALPNTLVTVAPKLAPAAALATLLTPTLLHRLGARDPDAWAPPIVAACAGHDINTPLRIAAFLANVMVETGALATLIESLNYSPEGLLKTWPNRFTSATALALGRTATKPANQRAIAETAYGGRLGNGPPGSGDGWMFRGRGLIQLTGRANYRRFADRIGVGIEKLPDQLATPQSAALSAAQFWQTAGCNQLSDNGDIVAVRLAVNGGSIGLEKVRALYRQARTALAIR